MNPPTVKLGLLLRAFTDPPREVRETPAFIHKATGDVLFVQGGDEAAAKWFPNVPLGRLKTMLANDASWLAVPKY